MIPLLEQKKLQYKGEVVEEIQEHILIFKGFVEKQTYSLKFQDIFAPDLKPELGTL